MQEEAVPSLQADSIRHSDERKIVFKDNKIVRDGDAPNDYSDILPELGGLLDKPSFDAAFIRDLISSDEICRGRDGNFVGWPLLDGDDIYRMYLEFRLRGYDTYMPFALSKYDRIMTAQMIRDSLLLNPQKALMRLLQRWPLIDEILHEGEGHLLLAGGSVSAALFDQSCTASTDLDFYFIGFDRDDTAEADRLLEKLINFLQQKFIDEETRIVEELGHFEGKRFRISRSYTVVTIVATIYYGDDGNEEIGRTYEIQFILRLYPKTSHLLTDISMPLGGFDLHSCAVGYYLHPDTMQGVFYATTAGAFSLATKTNLVVTSRFSPSMVYRLKKYKARGFEILFTGTSKERQSRESINNMLHWKTKSAQMEIYLPFMTVTKCSTATYESQQSDYSMGSDNGSYRQSNLIALMSGRSEQYCVIGESWNQVLNEPKASFLKRSSITKMMEKFSKEHRRMTDPMVGIYVFQDIRKQLRSIFSGIIAEDLLKTHFIAEQQKIDDLRQTINKASRMNLGDEHDLPLSKLDLAQLRLDLSSRQNDLKVELRPLIDEEIINLCMAEDADFDKYLVEKEAQIFEMMSLAEAKCLTEMKNSVKWNVTNPLTQHTASCNPTIVDPRAWYGKNKRGEDNYVPFRVGFPDEIFFILKCAFTNYGQGTGMERLGALSVFKQLIVPYCARVWAASLTERLVSVCRANYKLNSQYRYLDGVVKKCRYDGLMYNPELVNGYIKGRNELYAKLDSGDDEIVKVGLAVVIVPPILANPLIMLNPLQRAVQDTGIGEIEYEAYDDSEEYDDSGSD